jgi:hypothetical protein
MKTRIYVIALAIFSLSLLYPKSVQADEPTPGVARVSLIHGDVAAMRGDSGDWVATTVNAPLVRGDKISTGAHSRAEIELDYANILRLDQRSEATIADLTRTRIQLQVASGLVDFTVMKGSEANVEIDTPNMAVRPLGEGVYRIQVNSPSNTEVTVRKGEAEVTTPQGSATVEKNQVIYVKGTDAPEYQIAKAERKDDWDDWNNDRDRAIADAQSWRYADRQYTGGQDLDRYGHWTYVPDYDWCWTPYVNAGWVPYADGRWVWEPYWGWTWVSYEPWGWAPYHYGRWLNWGNSWCWWPGYGVYGAAWAPAYVSFFGFGRHFGVGFGFGSIGWLPLGPRDGFHPWWGHHNGVNVVNITNITNVTNITNINNRGGAIGRRDIGSNIQGALNNANIRRAITTTSTDNFINGRIPRGGRTTIDANTLRQASVMQGMVPAVPNHNSLRPVDRPAVVPAGARANSNQQFFSTHGVPAGPTPFAQHAESIRQMLQHPTTTVAESASGVGKNPINNARPGTMRVAPAAAPANNVSRPAQGNAATRAQTAANASTAARPQPRAYEGNGQSIWQRFGSGRASATAPLTQPSTNVTEAQNRAPAKAQTPPAAQTAQKTTAQPAQTAPRTNQDSGWQRFGSRPAGSAPAANTQTQRWPSAVNMPSSNSGNAPRASEPRAAAPQSQGQSGWSRFSQQSAPRSTPSGQGMSAPRPVAPQQAPQSREGGWSRFENQPAPRSYGNSGNSGGYSRQPLNLNKPIVAPRSYGSYGGGRGYSAPSGGGRGYSAPSGGGRSYSAPSGGGRGYSAPSGGGRGSSAPSGGGGHSAPSGGGHSSGGSSGGHSGGRH